MLRKTTRVSSPKKSAKSTRKTTRREPAQARALETVAVILEGAAQILEAGGLRAFNTNALAERAGVSVGTVYQYFENKDEILRALLLSFEQELKAAIGASPRIAENDTLERAMRRYVRAMLDVHWRRAKLFRILEAEEERLLDPEAQRANMTEILSVLQQVLRAHRDEVRTRSLREAAEDILAIARAIADACLERECSRTTAERRVMRAVMGYLISDAIERVGLDR